MQIIVRQAQPEDIGLLSNLFYRLSDRTRYLRYFQPFPLVVGRVVAEVQRMVRRVAPRGLSLVATIQSEAQAEATGVAELASAPQSPSCGEFAVLVRDDWQGRGVGTLLGRRLIAEARRHGFVELHGHVLPENRAALRLLKRLGVPYTTSFDGGLIHAVCTLTGSASADE